MRNPPTPRFPNPIWPSLGGTWVSPSNPKRPPSDERRTTAWNFLTSSNSPRKRKTSLGKSRWKNTGLSSNTSHICIYIYIQYIQYKQNLEPESFSKQTITLVMLTSLETTWSYFDVLYIKCHAREVFFLPCSALQRILLPMWPRWQLPWTWTLDLTQFHTF